MIKIENHLGIIDISHDYLADLVGHAAAKCFGVSGMVVSTPVQSLRSVLLRSDAVDKGVRVRLVAGKLVVDLHIAVTYGLNIGAIVKSIVGEVRYAVEEATGFRVEKVNVYVDTMKPE